MRDVGEFYSKEIINRAVELTRHFLEEFLFKKSFNSWVGGEINKVVYMKIKVKGWFPWDDRSMQSIK